MKRLFLFPSKFRVIGLITLIPAIALYIANAFYGFSIALLKMGEISFKTDSSIILNYLHYFNSSTDIDYTNDLAYFLILVALCFIAFSKLKNEDEMSIQIRFQTFQIATYICCVLLFLLDVFTYDLIFLSYLAMLWYAYIILFIIIFYTKIYLLTKSLKNEK